MLHNVETPAFTVKTPPAQYLSEQKLHLNFILNLYKCQVPTSNVISAYVISSSSSADTRGIITASLSNVSPSHSFIVLTDLERKMQEIGRNDKPKLRTLDQLLRQRAADANQTPLLAFPKSRHGFMDYEPISGALLDQFVDGAVRSLRSRGFAPMKHGDEDAVMGICAPTDLDYIVTVFACIRLGYIPFLISHRLAPSAISALLNSQGCECLLFSPENKSLSIKDENLKNLNLQNIPSRDEYGKSAHGPNPGVSCHDADIAKESSRPCILLHSSGSTGLPKTINIDNQKLMAVAAYAQDLTAFITAPFSHSFGLLSYMQALHKRRTIYAISGFVPQTCDTLATAITAANPEIIWTVPYALKLLTENPKGVDALKNCRFISSAGSKLPDEIGDMLTEAGVKVGMQFGSTETGLILSSAYRPQGDKAWNYLRPPPHVAPFLQFRLADDELYECIVLDGHKGKTMSNSNDPYQSWHTNDLFSPHPTIANAWKFIGRMDDRITLLNGEKVLPLSIEGRIRQHPLVREAVVFGIDREAPGLLLFRATGTGQLNDHDFLDQVWPAIQDANRKSESFAQISRECIAILGEQVDCPTTEKSSIRRGQIYKELSSVIEGVYQSLESGKRASLRLLIPDLENWIMDEMKNMGHTIRDANADFFASGVDSLKAIQLRTKILKNIDLGGNESECTSTIIYDCGTPARLAIRLYRMRTGSHLEGDKISMRNMEDLIEENSKFASISTTNKAQNDCSNGDKVVILTGATGFLGAHVLAALVAAENVSKVYSFVRAKNANQQSIVRLQNSLKERDLDIPLNKVTVLPVDMATENLGLDSTSIDLLKATITHVIYCAWPVNFVLPLSAFNPHIRSLHYMLQLCLDSTQKACLLFCSSISTAQLKKDGAHVASQPIADLDDAAPTGYARSKLVGERIVEAAAAAGARASILRIGQIVPGLSSKASKLWNPDEAIPLMIRSCKAQSTGCLPILSPDKDCCSWIPVDILADTILDLAHITVRPGAEEGMQLVYNVTNPCTFSWRDELLPALRSAGLNFETLPWEEWLERLERSSDDLAVNQSKKLIDFWKNQAHGQKPVIFDTEATVLASPSMQKARRLVDGDYIHQVVDAWKATQAL